jgi:hypothetical protein
MWLRLANNKLLGIKPYTASPYNTTRVIPPNADDPSTYLGENEPGTWGIVWRFAEPVQYGQFVNGEYWVVPTSGSSVIVTSVFPDPVWNGDNVVNGSMVNPGARREPSWEDYDAPYNENDPADFPRALIGFDYDSANYDSGVAVSFPLELVGGSSLLSSKSHPERDTSKIDLIEHVTTWANVGKSEVVAVLTVLSTPASSGSFRPPYFGADKPLYNISTANWDVLPKVIPSEYIDDNSYDFEDTWIEDEAGRQPSMGSIAKQYLRYIQKPYILFVYGFEGRSTHPTQNMPNYHKENLRLMSEVSALLCCDLDMFGDEGDLRSLAIAYAQLGIDMHHINILTGPDSTVTRAPSLFAGALLQNSGMLNGYVDWFESDRIDYQIYERSEATSTLTSAYISPDAFFHGNVYGWRQKVGDQNEFQHLDQINDAMYYCVDGTSTTQTFGTRYSYMQINCPQYIGVALMVHLMNLRTEYNAEKLFDFIAWWLSFSVTYRDIIVDTGVTPHTATLGEIVNREFTKYQSVFQQLLLEEYGWFTS